MLPPAPFDPDVTTVAMGPVAFDPARMRTWRFSVVSGDPDVTLTVPAVVAGMPGPTRMFVWRSRNHFYRAWRWGADTDDDLGIGRGASCQHGSESEDE
jgi:hypothetical protein